MLKTSLLNPAYSRTALILLAFIAFISLGLPDGLMGVAWPSIRDNFARPLDSLGLLLLAGTVGYSTSSFLAGYTMSRLGVGGLLAGSCALTGLALVGYTIAPVWEMMIVLVMMAGLGAGAIDAGINTYVATHFGERLMQWLHASWGIGVTLGPLIMTIGISSFESWRWGYVGVGTAQLLLAAGFLLTWSLWEQQPAEVTTHQPEQKLTDYKTPLTETLLQPMAWVSVSMFFLYTGIEATLGNWTYSLLTESRGIDSATAGLWAGSYWAMFTVGRVLAGFYTRHISMPNLIRLSLTLAFTGAGLLWLNAAGWMSLAGVALIGFAIAPIFPGLVSGTEERVGAHHAANTIGMQLGLASVGAALLPGLAGVLARRISLEIIPIFLMVVTALLLGLYVVSQLKKVESSKF